MVVDRIGWWFGIGGGYLVTCGLIIGCWLFSSGSLFVELVLMVLFVLLGYCCGFDGILFVGCLRIIFGFWWLFFGGGVGERFLFWVFIGMVVECFFDWGELVFGFVCCRLD